MYGKDSVQKLECIGHVQKHVGCRHRKLQEIVHGLGGKGKLTDALIDCLQNYYGIAKIANVGNLSAMKQATLASLFYCSSTDKQASETWPVFAWTEELVRVQKGRSTRPREVCAQRRASKRCA